MSDSVWLSRLNIVLLCVTQTFFCSVMETPAHCCVRAYLWSDGVVKASTQSHNPPVRLWTHELSVIISIRWRYRRLKGLCKENRPWMSDRTWWITMRIRNTASFRFNWVSRILHTICSITLNHFLSFLQCNSFRL